MEFLYSARWVLRPASVRGVEVAKASAAAKTNLEGNDDIFEFYKLLAGNIQKNCLLGMTFMFFQLYFECSADLESLLVIFEYIGTI